jgi:hypothetical protein
VIELNNKDIDAFYKSIGVLVKQNSSPNLQKPQIDSFLKLIQDSLAKCLESSTGICTEKFSQELLAMVKEAALERLPPRDSEECGLFYDGFGIEYVMWMMGLISMSWIINDLKVKTEQGYCWIHRSADNSSNSGGTSHGASINNNDKEDPINNNIPCKIASKFHIDFYSDCLKSFEQLLHIARSNPPKEVE